jgi:hypothetical protein
MGLPEIITRCMQKNPAQRYATMDELVNALIQIYRGIAGPGMSTYMEAFPVSGRGPATTPPPVTGPVTSPTSPMMVGMAHAPTQTPQMMQMPGSGPVPIQSGGSGPHQLPSSGSSAAMYPGYPGSGAAYQGVPLKKSNTGLILAIVAVVLVGGGIAAFAALSGGKQDSGSGSGSGSGSQVIAAVEDAGSGAGPVTDPKTAPADAGVPVDAAPPADAPEPPKDAGAIVPETVDILIKSKYHPSFEVWESDKKLFDGPDNLPVVVGESRKITIKARGYKEKTFTVASDAKGHKLEFKLDRDQTARPGPGPGPGPGSGSGSSKPTPTADPGCRNVVVDSKNAACLKQYCQFHDEDLRCTE